MIRVPEGTLRYWRHLGSGPKSFKMGPRRVVYREQDVLEWVDAQYAERGTTRDGRRATSRRSSEVTSSRDAYGRQK
jgi:hypothetical protein